MQKLNKNSINNYAHYFKFNFLKTPRMEAESEVEKSDKEKINERKQVIQFSEFIQSAVPVLIGLEKDLFYRQLHEDGNYKKISDFMMDSKIKVLVLQPI